MYSFLPYVLFFVLLLFYEGSSTRDLHVHNSLKIYQFGGELYINQGEPSIVFEDGMGITTFSYLSNHMLFVSCLGECSTNVYIPATTKLQIEGGGDFLRVQDIHHVQVNMDEVEAEIQDPKNLYFRLGKGNLRLDSSHTKNIDAIVGNGNIFSSFTGAYHNIKQLRTLHGETQIYFDESYSNIDMSNNEDE